jgi:hypothetical protein
MEGKDQSRGVLGMSLQFRSFHMIESQFDQLKLTSYLNQLSVAEIRT